MFLKTGHAFFVALVALPMTATSVGTPPLPAPLTTVAEVQRRAPPLRLRTAQDQEFRTMLRDAYRGPANFAGRYVLTSIGCGAACVLVAALDKRSGDVAWLPFTVCCWDARIAEPVEFRRDSDVLVIHGQRNEQGSTGPHYYRFVAGRFVER